MEKTKGNRCLPFFLSCDEEGAANVETAIGRPFSAFAPVVVSSSSPSRRKNEPVVDRHALLYVRSSSLSKYSSNVFSIQGCTLVLLRSHLSSRRRFGWYYSFFSIHRLCSETMDDIDYRCILSIENTVQGSIEVLSFTISVRTFLRRLRVRDWLGFYSISEIRYDRLVVEACSLGNRPASISLVCDLTQIICVQSRSQELVVWSALFDSSQASLKILRSMRMSRCIHKGFQKERKCSTAKQQLQVGTDSTRRKQEKRRRKIVKY